MALKRESNLSDEFKSERSRKGWLKKSRKDIGKAISSVLNSKSKEEKFRIARTAHEGLGNSQLTCEQAIEVKHLIKTGNYNYRDIALMYDCHYNTIKSIARKTGRYANVPDV